MSSLKPCANCGHQLDILEQNYMVNCRGKMYSKEFWDMMSNIQEEVLYEFCSYLEDNEDLLIFDKSLDFLKEHRKKK